MTGSLWSPWGPVEPAGTRIAADEGGPALVGGWDATAGATAPDLPGPDDPRLTDVLPACVAALDPHLPGADPRAAELLGIGEAPQVLVLLVDGLGWVPLSDHLAHAPVLRAHRSSTAVVHTVVPSTTAAAITSFGTGEPPGRTRMVGYSVLGDAGVMNLLAFAPGVDPEAWQPRPTIFEGLGAAGVGSAVVSPATFAGSGLTRAALRGARHVGALSWGERIHAALRELRAGTPLVYLYWSEIDHRGHADGVDSDAWTLALEEFDAGLRELLAGLPRGVRAVLTADHGMVDTSPAHLIDLASRPDLNEGVAAVAGETRAVHLHAREGREEAVVARWREILGDGAWIVDRASMPALLGGAAGAEVVGDAFVFLRGRRGIVDSRVQSAGSIGLVGVHGSMTSDEMLVPVTVLA